MEFVISIGSAMGVLLLGIMSPGPSFVLGVWGFSLLKRQKSLKAMPAMACRGGLTYSRTHRMTQLLYKKSMT